MGEHRKVGSRISVCQNCLNGTDMHVQSHTLLPEGTQLLGLTSWTNLLFL